MKLNVELLSVLVYTDKNGDKSTRLGYRLIQNEYKQNTDKIKGFSELSYFVKGTELFDKMKPEYFGVQAEIELIETPSTINPLRNVKQIKTIKVGQNVVNLL